MSFDNIIHNFLLLLFIFNYFN